SNRIIKIIPGNLLSYILPDRVNLDAVEKVTFNFRVSQPVYETIININLNGKLLKKIKKSFMLPAEMESIELLSSQLEPGTLEVEVANA
ncbi:MAG: hypothetical protein PHP65_02835, partial [Bacilli bacterium]|nr:hypothetical protein [Bacilli bacterium]